MVLKILIVFGFVIFFSAHLWQKHQMLHPQKDQTQQCWVGLDWKFVKSKPTADEYLAIEAQSLDCGRNSKFPPNSN